MTSRQKFLLHAAMQVFVQTVFLLFHLANLMGDHGESDGSMAAGAAFILLIQGGFSFGGWAIVHYNVKVRD